MKNILFHHYIKWIPAKAVWVYEFMSDQLAQRLRSEGVIVRSGDDVTVDPPSVNEYREAYLALYMHTCKKIVLEKKDVEKTFELFEKSTKAKGVKPFNESVTNILGFMDDLIVKYGDNRICKKLLKLKKGSKSGD